MTITISARMLLRAMAGPQTGIRGGDQDPGEADICYKTETPLI